MTKTLYADVVLTNAQGQILLLHRTYGDSFMAGKWCFPGGHVEENEDPTIAAQRETLEETGLNVSVTPLFIKEKEDAIVHYYEGKVDALPQITLDEAEHRGYEWVNKEDVKSKDLICDLADYIEEELLKITPINTYSDIRPLTPEESLDSNFQMLTIAFDDGILTEQDFFKARELYLLAKQKQAIDVLQKAFDQDLITESQYWDAIVKGGDASHGGKLVKKIITQVNGKVTTKWVDRNTGEELQKEPKVKSESHWYQSFTKYKLNCYPIGVDPEKVQVNEEGDTDSHWILKWKDTKSGLVKNAYSKEFMARNAAEKWNRMKNVSSEQIKSIADNSRNLFKDEAIDERYKEAGAILNIISQTGLRRGDKAKFKITGNRGVTSLSPENIKIEGNVIKFDFRGKAYQDNEATIEDKDLALFLANKIKQKEGKEFLFDTSDDIVDKAFVVVGGKGLKIKDMRTYVAGDIARKVLFEDPTSPPPVPKDIPQSEIKKLVEKKLNICYEKVSKKLNNTPIMAKNSYIHPHIIDFWLKNLNLDFEFKKSETLIDTLGLRPLANKIMKVFAPKVENKIPSLDEILAAYPKELIQETDCIDEDDEEDCDMFNEPTWFEDELEKSQSIVEDYFEKGGTKAFLGEIRKFGDRDYIKTVEGWIFYGKGTGAKAKEHAKGIVKKPTAPLEKESAEKPTIVPTIPMSYTDLDLSTKVSAGGSGGAFLVKGKDGKKYILKEQVGDKNTKDHLLQEKLSDNIHDILGNGIAKGTVCSHLGETYKITEFAEGFKDLNTYVSNKTIFEKARTELKKGFVTDCLLLNWDVIGASYDNVVVNEVGQVKRIDNGGSLLYRAKAGKKSTSSLTAEVTEIDVMRSSKNESAKKIFGDITDEEIKNQVASIVDKRADILSLINKTGLSSVDTSTIADLISKRIDWLNEKYLTKPKSVVAEIEVKKPATEKHPYESDVTNEYFKNWDKVVLEGNEGIKEGIKAHIISIEKANQIHYKTFAKDRKISVEEYKQKLQAHVEKLVANSDFFRATDIGVLDTILNDSKRCKSQFETGTSHGSLSPDYRAATEFKYFKFNKDPMIDKEKRPIYGYFSDNPNGVINTSGEVPPPCCVSMYGSVTVKMKKSVKNKTTVCFKDSLGSPEHMACTPANHPHFTSIDIANSPKDPLDKDSVSKSSSYVECQYHNQLTIDDIDSVCVSPYSAKGSREIPNYELINKVYSIVRKTHLPVTVFGNK